MLHHLITFCFLLPSYLLLPLTLCFLSYILTVGFHKVCSHKRCSSSHFYFSQCEGDPEEESKSHVAANPTEPRLRGLSLDAASQCALALRAMPRHSLRALVIAILCDDSDSCVSILPYRSCFIASRRLRAPIPCQPSASPSGYSSASCGTCFSSTSMPRRPGVGMTRIAHYRANSIPQANKRKSTGHTM